MPVDAGPLMHIDGWDSLKSLSHLDRSAKAGETTAIYAYRKKTSKTPFLAALPHSKNFLQEGIKRYYVVISMRHKAISRFIPDCVNL